MRFLIVSFFFATAWNQADAVPTNLSAYFTDEDACFLLYDVNKGETVTKYNDKRCSERVPACSTFKVALALMAFDKGILKDENTSFKWDGKDYGMPGWNKDQTAASWIKESVVWVSQRITKQLGKETVEKYLKDFGYGTADMSGGIETAWLTVGTPLNRVTKTTLLISAEEQVRFLTKLWKGELLVSKQAMEMTKKLTFVEISPHGYQLNGKTGSGFVGEDHASRIGWFVAHLGKPKEEYISVVSFTASKKAEGNRYAGYEAREKMKRVLTQLGKF
jgi:beta-lactamase class D